MSFEEYPAGFVECQACDAPAVQTINYEGKPTVLCRYHVRLLGKHKSFAEALEARARRENKK